jgi:uncharacterized protein YjcR
MAVKKTAKKNVGGRPKIQLDEKMKKIAEKAYSVGMTIVDVAKLCEIAPNTLRREMGQRLEQAKADREFRLKDSAYARAEAGLSDQLHSLILRTQYGWTENKLENKDEEIPHFRISFEK